MPALQLQAIDKVYPNGHVALRGIDLEVAAGELVVLVGPSGSGKSSALRIAAGLEAPSRGRVYIGERDVTQVSARARDIAMVFQSYALYPHKNVRENLAFGLRMRGLPRAQIDALTLEIAQRLGLSPLLERKPAQLSGGQRQRVALGRALVRRPQVFLLDEPLSNLDAQLRAQMRVELSRLHDAFEVTTLYVTHDQEEAMTLGQRIAVLGEHGRLEQLGTPLQVYQQPSSRFVADFIGMPRINWFLGELRDHTFACPDFQCAVPQRSGASRGRSAWLGVRPHDLHCASAEAAPVHARIDLIEALGHATLVHARTERGSDLRVLLPASARAQRSELIHLAPDQARIHLFDAAAGTRL